MKWWQCTHTKLKPWTDSYVLYAIIEHSYQSMVFNTLYFMNQQQEAVTPPPHHRGLSELNYTCDQTLWPYKLRQVQGEVHLCHYEHDSNDQNFILSNFQESLAKKNMQKPQYMITGDLMVKYIGP